MTIFVLLASAAQADEMLVEKEVFTTVDFETVGGELIPEVSVGWEAWGEPNKDRSNVILVTHFFSGTSHAAGKYSPDDPEPGYWDAIIGPGKAIDTNEYYVVSVDTLANANVHDPNVVTTGPASIDPGTGKPYGLDFPVVTIRDFVEVQRRLLDDLGVERLHAVIGASMGALQALEWAVAYPDRVERMVSVIGAGRMRAWEIALLESWAVPIRLDPNWRGGDYYGRTRPLDGLTAAMMLVTQNALHPDFFAQQFGAREGVQPGPLASIENGFPVTDWLRARARERAELQDANHVLYLVRASQLFFAGHGGSLDSAFEKVRAKSLFLPAAGDLLLRPGLARDAHRRLKALGKPSRLEEIHGTMGHLDGVYGIATKAEVLREFLED